jgi:hypothetical protein
VTSRTQALAERREELVARSIAQRDALVAEASPLLHKAAALDRVIGSVRRHPLVSGLATLALLILGSRKLIELGAQALALYGLFKRLRAEK